MKKRLIALIALLCTGVVLVASVLSLGGPVVESLFDAEEKIADASTLADEIATTAVAPANDTPLPSGYEKWDGTIATGFASGTGEKADPFLISTPAEFAFLILACKQYSAAPDGTVYYTAHYRLTSDLVFNDDFEVNGKTLAPEVKSTLTPFSGATHTTDFAGTFDGGGHILYNLYVPYQTNSNTAGAGTSIFGQVAGTIIDLHIVRGYMEGSDIATAPGGGTFARTLTGTIDGCSSGMTCYFRGGSVGGIVGSVMNKSATKSAVVRNCTFTGNIYCVANSTDASARPGNGAGGIIGCYAGDDGAGYTRSITLTDCINRGNVYSDGQYIGGIIGKISGSHHVKPESFAIARCVNFGNVYSTYKIPSGGAESYRAFAGGIVGGAGYMLESALNPNYHFEFCANFGTVSAQENAVGGIIGGMIMQNECTNSPLNFYSCYSLGRVLDESPDGERNERLGGRWNGGLVGAPTGSVGVYDCIVGGVVRGTSCVGGLVGRLSADKPYNGAGASNLTVIGTHVTADVAGKDSVGCLVGLYRTGFNKENTTLTLKGSYIEGVVNAETKVGSLIGSLDKARGGALAQMKLEYSITDVRVEKTVDTGRASILIGSSITDCVPTITQTEFYAANEVYNLSSGTAVQIKDAKVMYGLTSITLDTPFAKDNLTNGIYLNRLEFGSVVENSKIKWVSSTLTKKPIHENVDLMQTLALTRSYDGTASQLEHRDWLGVTPVCGWEKWDGTDWVPVYEAPRSVGRYRVSAALLSSRATGAAVLEFEITKKLVDFAKLEWSGDLAPTYTGHEYTVELGGVPAGITVTYTGSRNVNAGIYYSHLVSVVDNSGNYEIINVSSVTDRRWEIKSAVLDMRNVDWSNVDPATGKPKLIYNEKEQAIILQDKTDPTRDLATLLNITYSGNTATNAGTNYYATANVSYNVGNVQVSYPRDEFTTYWDMARREIRPWAEAEFVGGTATSDGITVVYDAREHALGYKGNLSTAVSCTIAHLSADWDGEDDGKYQKAGKYSYTVTFTLSDTANNYFAVASPSAPDVFVETGDATLTATRYLEIQKATPKIFGAMSQDTTYVSWDPEGEVDLPDGGTAPQRPTTFRIGVQYNQDKTLRYDENGNLISTLFVDGDGIADFRAELAQISLQEYFSVTYYLLTEEEVDGEIVIKEVPVKNAYGDLPYNAGTYRAVVTYRAPEDSNFTNATTTVQLIINPATYDLPLNIVMRNEQVDEDGMDHILRLQYEETLPSFITPVYTCNGTEDYPYKPGKYLFQVDFVFSEEMEGNYQPLKSMRAYLTIVTKSLYDSATGVSLTFKDGTYWRLLINQRTDVDTFVTDWTMGYDTRLASLYQIELKDELSNVWILEEPVRLRLPLTPEMAKSENYTPVYITIDEKGKFTITEIEDFTTEMITSAGALPRYIEFDVERIGYYGIVTSVDDSPNVRGRMIWLIVAACMVPPAGILIALAVGSRLRKKKDNDTQA